jgi:prepilin-type N-terminal cleavage/methylation domain-containing protein
MITPYYRGRPGFTLLEVMVVLFISGLLVAIAVPQFVSAREKSQATTCRHILKEILGAKERWAMDHSKDAEDEPALAELAKPGVYLRGMPVCPSGGDYKVGKLAELPECNVGGVAGEKQAHVLP